MLLLAAAVCGNLPAADLVGSAPQENDVKVVRRWDFNSYGNTEGWTVPDSLKGAVMGGSLWLPLQRIPPVKQPPIAHRARPEYRRQKARRTLVTCTGKKPRFKTGTPELSIV